jgi:hypothetical protein
MAYLKPKNIYGKTYWYVVESRRVNGQIKTVNLAYLGKADDILSRWQQLSTPKDCLKSYSHGAVAVMLSLAKQLGIAEIINTHIKPPSRGSRQRKTPSVGDTLVMAAIGRALHPTSKRIKGWWVGWYESGKRKAKALPTKALAEHYRQIKYAQMNSDVFTGTVTACPGSGHGRA